MKRIRNLVIPTGNICVVEGEKGPLEFLSIGDYGKERNVKADFLGLTRDIAGVPNGAVMPLQEKWVVTISTQYGCSMGCKFCDVPKVGPGVNATMADMIGQVTSALELHPEVEATKRLNVHYVRMGEPTFNPNVLDASYELRRAIRPYVGRSLVHPVVSTMLPRKNKDLMRFLNEWTVDIKNYHFRGDAGLQFSINSTNDGQRDEMFNGNSLSLGDVSEIGRALIDPVGRKYALNFALADEYEVDAHKLLRLFDPKKFMVKITPIHATQACSENSIATSSGYDSYTPYQDVECQLKHVGFDVIVFVPSYEEDLGMVTCGNAVLSGRNPQVKYTEE